MCPWTLAPSKGLLTPLGFSFSELENGDVGNLTVDAIGFLGFSGPACLKVSFIQGLV